MMTDTFSIPSISTFLQRKSVLSCLVLSCLECVGQIYHKTNISIFISLYAKWTMPDVYERFIYNCQELIWILILLEWILDKQRVVWFQQFDSFLETFICKGYFVGFFLFFFCFFVVVFFLFFVWFLLQEY